MSYCENKFSDSMYNVDAVVVGMTVDQWIVAYEAPRKERMFRLNRESRNITNKDFPRIRESIIIRDLDERPDEEDPTLPSTLVTMFQYTPQRDKEFVKEEIMAVAKVQRHYVTLVAMSFTDPVEVCVPFDTNPLSVGQFVMASIYKLPPFIDVVRQKNVVLYKLNFSFQKKAQRGEIEIPQPRLYPDHIRPLTAEEEEHIFSRCAGIYKIELSEAQRFIQEPLIAAGLLEKFTKHQEVLKYQILVGNAKLGADGSFSFFINFEEYTRLFQTRSRETWAVGGDVQVVHKQLRLNGKENRAYMVIKRAEALRSGYMIYLCAKKGFDDLLKDRYKDAFKKENFQVSPIFNKKDAAVEALRSNFDDFFLQRRHLFDLCIGKGEKPEKVEIKDREKPFFVKGKPLDASQLDFVRSAASIPGFTCTQAPPGCGKTHSTAALVSILKSMGVKGGICVTGTTNAAVTNIADFVVANFPDIRISREYSLTAEGGITETSQKASLKHMVTDAGSYLDLNTHEALREELEKTKNAQEKLNHMAPNLHQHLSQVRNATKMGRKATKRFVEAYDVQVFATTVQLAIDGDIFRSSNVDEHKSVRRLIVDESAQMSPVEGMALYCSFPYLEYITLVGDMKQLGPHSPLPRDSACYKLISEGELTRMFKLPSTTKRELNTIYRCHPSITEKFLIPIYGPQLKSGVSAASRSLAKDHELLVSADNSPCLLIDVEGQEEKGRNLLEMKTALDLIFNIVCTHNVKPEDVVVICNHKAQMNSLKKGMNDQGVLTTIFTKVALHTVDSFQGKEAKVIILLTTKTCHLHDTGEQTMKFVGDAARGAIAVSRAQHALYILGHWQSLAKTEFWAQFLRNMIVAEGIVNRHFEDTDVIPKLRTLIKFNIRDTVEEVKVEVVEPRQLEIDYKNSVEDVSVDPDLFLIDLSIPKNDPPQPVEVPVGDLISFVDLSISQNDPPQPVEVPVGDLISIVDLSISQNDPPQPVEDPSDLNISVGLPIYQNIPPLPVEVPVGDLISFD